jgi:hypothetical protein
MPLCTYWWDLSCMTVDSNVHVGWKRKLCSFEFPRADPGLGPNSSAARTECHVLQSACQYACQATATGMVSQPNNRNRWQQMCQTEAT